MRSDSERKHLLCCDIKVVFDNGEIWFHNPALLMYGKSDWWASLLTESSYNVVMLPGVSQVEIETIIEAIYGQHVAFVEL